MIISTTMSGLDPMTLGLEMHLKALQCLEKLSKRIERQYVWIDEALIEAKSTFSSPEIRMIPKTPSAKRCRKMAQVQEDDEDDFQETKPKPKSRTTKGSAKTKRGAKATKSQDESVNSEASIDTDQEGSVAETSSGRPLRSGRARKVKQAPASTGSRSTRATRRNKPEETDPILRSEDIVCESDEPTEPHTMGGALKANHDMLNEIMEVEPVSKGRKSGENEECSHHTSMEVDEAPRAANGTIVLLSSDDDHNHTDEDVASPPKKSQRKSSADGSVPRRKSLRKESLSRVESPAADVSSSTTEMETHNSPDNIEAARNYHLLKVKEKASKYEEMVRRSTGSRDGSPAHLTPHSPRLTPRASGLNRSIATPTSSPRSAGATPPTIVKPVSRAPITLNKPATAAARHAFQTLLGASPRGQSPRAQSPRPASPAENQSAVRRSTRRRSSRVSGSKLSLSKRRSSVHRHKTRASIELIQKSSHLQDIKNRLMNASATNNNSVKQPSSPAPVRSTRSKMRIAATKDKQTPEKPRSKLCLTKMEQMAAQSMVVASSASDHTSTEDDGQTPKRSTRSKMRVKAPHLGTSDSGDGSDSPDAGYLQVAPPSTMAPTRSTRSKARKLQDNNRSSPYVNKPKRIAGAHSDESPPKKPCAGSPESSMYHSPDRVHQAVHPQSFLSQLKKNRATPTGLNNTVTSFLQRNTPSKKPSTKEIIEQRRQQLLAKEEQSKNRRLKVQEDLHRQAEEKKKIREQRQQLAAQRRKEHEKDAKEAKEREQRREQEKLLSKAKQTEMKQREEREKQKMREKKLEEVRRRELEMQKEREQQIREQEIEKQRQVEYQLRRKEYEQQQRQKQMQEQRHKLEERQAELERERQQEIERLRQQEEQRHREEESRLKEKEERERRERADREKHELERQKERERQKLVQLEVDRDAERQRLHDQKEKLEEERRAKEEEKRLQRLIEKHNNAVKPNTSHNTSHNTSCTSTVSQYKPAAKQTLNTTMEKPEAALNTTFNKDQESKDDPDSYDMTPVRKVYKKKTTEENYCIDEIKSDDSTDDEEAPRKKIPSWATGPQLKAHLITQFYTPPDLDKIFNYIEQPDLCKMFKKKKPTFYKRTSSAQWSSPMYLPSGKPYLD